MSCHCWSAPPAEPTESSVSPLTLLIFLTTLILLALVTFLIMWSTQGSPQTTVIFPRVLQQLPVLIPWLCPVWPLPRCRGPPVPQSSRAVQDRGLGQGSHGLCWPDSAQGAGAAEDTHCGVVWGAQVWGVLRSQSRERSGELCTGMCWMAEG